MITISYNTILKQFDSNIYHIGYLMHDDLIKLLNFPIKVQKPGFYQFRDNIYNNSNNYGLIVIKHTLDYDYSIIKDTINLLKPIEGLSFQYDIDDYVSLKIAQILAGTGQYGKNQIIYDKYFGFETHVSMVIIQNQLIDLPNRELPNWEYLPQCTNCNDCKNACPINALHNDDIPPWVDWVACNMFNRYGDHPVIPSMKWGWGKYIVNPPLSDNIISQIQTTQDLIKLTGYDFIPSHIEDKYIQYPICRECTSQPKCSKFNGHYPYNKDRVKLY